MNLKILQFLLVLISIAVCFEVPTCCPEGYELEESSRGLFRSSQLQCVRSERNSTTVLTIGGFRVKQSNQSKIPSCFDPIFIKVIDHTTLTTNSCVYERDGKLHAITCSGHPFIVSVLNKCCPFGESYNSGKRMCDYSDSSLRAFDDLYGHMVILKNASFDCSSSEVIVEYFSSENKFLIDERSLVIMGAKFDPHSICLDTSFNSSRNRSENRNSKPEFIARTCNSLLVCDLIPCVRRCCQDKQKFAWDDGAPMCSPHPVDHHITFHKFNPDKVANGDNTTAYPIVPKAYGMLRELECEKYPLDPDNQTEDEHYFHYEDGSLHLPRVSERYKNSEYCFEFVESPQGIKPYTFVCFDDADEEVVRFNLYIIGLLISSVFCGITLLVYVCVPKLRNLPGKILVCLVLCLLSSYLSMAIGQISPAEGKACYPFAIFMYFSLMAAFSWMNVMCYDIWITFSSSERSHHRLWKSRETKRFLLYSLYGWGLPALLTILTITLGLYNVLPLHLRPKFGGGRCWFETLNVAPHLLFFLGPAGILIICNFILFIFTTKYCNQVKREIDRLQSSNAEKPVLKRRLAQNRARTAMNFKLFVVMGASWVLEILSTVLFDSKYYILWVMFDFYNSLQGVFVFLIFVFKWKVWYLLLDRLGIKYKNRYKTKSTNLGTTMTSFSGSSNCVRMKSIESCASLLNNNVQVTQRSLNSRK